MLGRLVQKADFERLLSARSWARSAHFAVHHLSGGPQRTPAWAKAAPSAELSTTPLVQAVDPVEDLAEGIWIGCVVPKRHARRAVTRNLLKRQIRGSFERHAAALPTGLWLVRLRAGFPLTDFVSARSAALALAVRCELDGLLARAR
jgi:ribonuclease P protein component